MALHFPFLGLGGRTANAGPNPAGCRRWPFARNFSKPEPRDHLVASQIAVEACLPSTLDSTWCAHRAVIRQIMSRKLRQDVALHFQEIMTSKQIKSMTYLTRPLSQCRRWVKLVFYTIFSKFSFFQWVTAARRVVSTTGGGLARLLLVRRMRPHRPPGCWAAARYRQLGTRDRHRLSPVYAE